MKETVKQMADRLSITLPTNYDNNVQFLFKLIELVREGKITIKENSVLMKCADVLIKKQREELKNFKKSPKRT